MEIIQLIATTSIIVSGILLVGFLNKRFNLGIEDTSSEFWVGASYKNQVKDSVEKDELIQSLSARVQVLEQLITDPKEQLRREIDRL
ncbi:MAG: hypothetical protein P8I03_12160 [Thalassotalea sp.]|nr:hypothetical protein [Thalassotalea sp.]